MFRRTLLGPRPIRLIDPLGAVVMEGSSPVAAARTLAGRRDVAWIEPDGRMEAAERIPSYPSWNQQWGQALVRAPEAWATTVGRPETVVAVLDTGTDRIHVDPHRGVHRQHEHRRPGTAAARPPRPRDDVVRRGWRPRGQRHRAGGLVLGLPAHGREGAGRRPDMRA